MRKFLVTRTREDGFTLIELLVVVIIIAILAAIAVPVYIGIQNNAKKSAIQSDVATTKLNVAAAFAEDGTFSKSLVMNSHSPKNETVTVYAADGATELSAGDTAQQFTVVGTDGNDIGGYSVSFKSTDGQSSQKNGTVIVGAQPVFTQDFETVSGGANRSTVRAHSGTYSADPGTWNGNTSSSAYAEIPGLTVGKTYTVSAWIYLETSSPEYSVIVNNGGFSDVNDGYDYFSVVSNQGIQSGSTTAPYSSTADSRNKWVKVSLTVKSKSASNYISVYGYNAGITTTSGTIYMDDVTVTPVS